MNWLRTPFQWLSSVSNSYRTRERCKISYMHHFLFFPEEFCCRCLFLDRCRCLLLSFFVFFSPKLGIRADMKLESIMREMHSIFCLGLCEPDYSERRIRIGAKTSSASILMSRSIFYSNNIQRLTLYCMTFFSPQVYHTEPVTLTETHEENKPGLLSNCCA